MGRYAFILIIMFAIGCSNKNSMAPPDHSATEDRLLKLGTAYLQSSYRLERAPQDFEELKPYLKGDVPDDFLKSPSDGQEFVVMWGVEYHRLPPHPKDPLTVAAFEKKGVGGKRYVLRFPLKVSKMTDEELRAAIFPTGFSPP